MTIKDSIADIPLRSRLVAAGLVFAIVNVVAYRQYVANYEWHERYSLLEWMFHPVDWNVDAGLPDIRNINAVQVVNSRPWIAGNGAFLAFGDGIGTRWTRVTYDEQAGRFTMPEASSTVAARWHIDGLVAATVYAAAQQSAAQRPVEQQKAPPPVQQGPPVEQKAPPVQQGPPAESKGAARGAASTRRSKGSAAGVAFAHRAEGAVTERATASEIRPRRRGDMKTKRRRRFRHD